MRIENRLRFNSIIADMAFHVHLIFQKNDCCCASENAIVLQSNHFCFLLHESIDTAAVAD